ncbi:MAG: hypothetical protein NTZ05_07295, partial [Chloroflexi bacterium]|nr:hypothetical protein [Chloroflexota bacterium]
VNGGFERGDEAWSDDCDCIGAVGTPETRHSGVYAATLKPKPGKRRGQIAQAVTVPSPAQAVKLTYWYRFTSNDTGLTDKERSNACLPVGVQVGADRPKVVGLRCLYDNVVDRTWQRESVDLTAYAGKTVFLIFGIAANTDYSHPTLIYVDDVSLSLQRPFIASGVDRGLAADR